MSEQSPPRFPRVVLDVPPELADEVAFDLIERGATGVEQRDDTTLDNATSGGVVTLLASFDSASDADDVCVELDVSWNPRRDDVVGDSWRDGWKQHFKPFHLTPRIVVCPPWKTIDAPEGVSVLVMDPGRAFGTGLHATTRLVADAIERQALAIVGNDVLDVGCGSGILSLCALVHGARSVRATDNDPDAVAATIENAERNGYAGRVVADTTDVFDLDGGYPMVVANIEARVLVPMAPALIARVRTGGSLVLSGILSEQAQDVIGAYAPLRVEATHESGGWVALEFRGGS